MRNAAIQRLIYDGPVIAFFSAACLFFCASAALLAAPQWRERGERLERVKSYETYILSPDGFDMIYRKLESKNGLLEAKLKGIAADAPSRSLSGVLQELIRRGKDCGVALAKIQPQSEAHSADSGYVSVLLETKTDYHKLGKYIVSLEALPQVLQIRKIAVETTRGGELSVKLLIRCFSGPEGGV